MEKIEAPSSASSVSPAVPPVIRALRVLNFNMMSFLFWGAMLGVGRAWDSPFLVNVCLVMIIATMVVNHLIIRRFKIRLRFSDVEPSGHVRQHQMKRRPS